MFQPRTLIPLLLLTSTASARLGSDLSGRHAHAAPHKKAAAAAVNAAHAVKDYIPDFEKIRRTGVDEMRKRTGLGGEKKKRKVKKRANTCRPQVPLQPANSTTIASGTASATASSSASSSIIGNEHLATDGATSQWGSATASASNSWQSASSTASSAGASPTGSYNSPWTLTETWQGSNFFDNFNFWEWDDPTHGTVDYVGASEAWNSGLISINNQGHAIMTVDQTKQISGGRKAVRIHGNLVYTGGMVLMDAVHMPTGCGTWPAWWSNGPNWPYGGEIDILEGVNAFNQNQVSLHTGPGCTMTNPVQTGQLTTGNYDNTNCDSFATSNSGCGVRDLSNDNSYGAAFNSIGGGVYATKWDKTGVSIWWFPRNQIPDDILADQPMPSTWGTPVGNFPATTCNPYQFMYDHFNIFTNTFCGDWAGADGIWNYAGYAGQDQSCAAMTGYSTCQAYVQNEGQNFNNAYWEVSYIKYFNSTSEV